MRNANPMPNHESEKESGREGGRKRESEREREDAVFGVGSFVFCLRTKRRCTLKAMGTDEKVTRCGWSKEEKEKGGGRWVLWRLFVAVGRHSPNLLLHKCRNNYEDLETRAGKLERRRTNRTKRGQNNKKKRKECLSTAKTLRSLFLTSSANTRHRHPHLAFGRWAHTLRALLAGRSNEWHGHNEIWPMHRKGWRRITWYWSRCRLKIWQAYLSFNVKDKV